MPLVTCLEFGLFFSFTSYLHHCPLIFFSHICLSFFKNEFPCFFSLLTFYLSTHPFSFCSFPPSVPFAFFAFSIDPVQIPFRKGNHTTFVRLNYLFFALKKKKMLRPISGSFWHLPPLNVFVFRCRKSPHTASFIASADAQLRAFTLGSGECCLVSLNKSFCSPRGIQIISWQTWKHMSLVLEESG